MSFNLSSTKGAPAEDGEAKLKLHSFLSLFEKIGTTKIDEKYVFTENPSVGAWKLLFETARMVRDLDVEKEAAREMARVCPSVFVRLAQHLKGEFLFPNLRDISIVGLNSSTHYLSLITSPVLENVLLEVDPGPGSAGGATHLAIHAFLGDLITFTPNLRSLVIKCIAEISPLWLDMITRFHHLKTLMLSSLDMTGLENLRPLGSLTHLQNLSLDFQHQEYEKSVPLNIPLPHLKYLHIAGPYEVTMELVRAIGTNDLEIFSFERAYKTPLKMPLKEKKKSAVTLSKREELLPMLSSLWGRSLKEISIISTVSLTWDLTSLASLRVLEKLHIEGSLGPCAERAIHSPSTLWCCLRLLHIPANFSVTFPTIQHIAESAPFLSDVSLFMDITKDPGIDCLQALFHPLESLTILRDGIETNSGWGNHEAYDDVGWLRLMKVARYLNALFPNLGKLDGMVRKKEWDRVWELVKLCQGSSVDEKGRKHVRVQAAS
ncbi:hypothetical protein P691DRAFT_826339 [Macrolepiota fuliginosa MF-IS2]|uniref:F-box domain-containing protein n=1 Tax=Macrolepiota fuliginosa MF-IS2 TaxID=1400762 RepID=A0A9P6C2L7_9AGAR|nr:hypothetical protein P691DRAFT_826339 [Macrolepiota fuliginosa MF-IS2]